MAACNNFHLMQLASSQAEQLETTFANGFPCHQMGRSLLIHADCFQWLASLAEASVHAVVTDPPYGVKEFDEDQIEKRQNGNGGIWRIPPAFDGSNRAPLPRFTALNTKERTRLREFFIEWSRLCLRALTPGAHVFVATNSFLSELVFEAICKGGLEFRGQLIRLVQTFRGGDRPKNAEKEFPDVCSLPRGAFEPWGIFRRPIPEKMTVAECLRKFKTGGLRRLPDGNPFSDVIDCGRTPQEEKDVAAHPSQKPLLLMHKLIYAALPLGEGVLIDPFMGSGSTIAAAEINGISAVGVERSKEYYQKSLESIPALIRLWPDQQIPLL